MNKLLRGVTAQLLLLTVLPLTFILAVISFASISMHQDAMRRLVSERDVRAVVATAGSIGAILQHKTDALQLVAESAMRTTTPQVQAVPLPIDVELAREFPGGIVLYDKDGAVLTSTSSAAEWAPTGMANPALTLPVGAPTSHIVVWNDALVLRTQDRSGSITIIGVLPVSALQFNAVVNPPGDATTVSVFLFGADGHVLDSTQPNRLNTDAHDHPGVVEALSGKSGGLFRPDPGSGDEHVVSYAPVVTNRGPTGLGVIIEEPWQTVLDPLMRYSLAMPLITLPVLLLAALAVTFGVRRIVQPLQRLDQQAREIGQGHYGALGRPVRGIEEVEQLQETLRTMANQIQADQERLRNYAHAVTETQETERKRLARELHDDTIQNLIVLSQRIQLMRQNASRDQPQVAARLDELRGMVVQMIEDIRRFSRALRPIYLEDAGLVAALERLAVEANTAHAPGAPASGAPASGAPTCQVTFSANAQVPRYTPEVELALYRIAQEALTNALRHASPGRVSITLEPLPDEGAGLRGAGLRGAQLRVEDDGHGFAVPSSNDNSSAAGIASGGFGLMGIRERALLIGARVDIHSEPGKGTRVLVRYQPAGAGI